MNLASISPMLLQGHFQGKLDADFYIYGSIKKAGPSIRIDAQLIDTKTNEVFKSFKIKGHRGVKMIFQIIDSLCYQVKNYLLISKLMKENSVSGFKSSHYLLSRSFKVSHYLFFRSI